MSELPGGVTEAFDPARARVGFIGLGMVGSRLAGSLLRNGVDLTVRDLAPDAARVFLDGGAHWADSPREMAESVDVVVTCLPSPAASAAVLEADDGVLAGLRPGQVWMEMSTTDGVEICRLAQLVIERGGHAVDCPVSGGCHRAATGNISIFAACDRPTFERVLPLLTVMGRHVLHTGELGTASTLKVMTNYLATANLLALTEALTTMAAAGVDLATTYEAIRISSGNSFVHETESQLILNGSRDIGFTIDLVLKDIGLFQSVADRSGVPLELNPLMIAIFADGHRRYGGGAWSDEIVRRLEEATGLSITAPGFPAELVDDEPEVRGAEVRRQRAVPM
jgi:3-hydroxyisobutyrate dehydrogenase